MVCLWKREKERPEHELTSLAGPQSAATTRISQNGIENDDHVIYPGERTWMLPLGLKKFLLPEFIDRGMMLGCSYFL